METEVVHYCTGLYWQRWPDEYDGPWSRPAGITMLPGEEIVALSKDDLVLEVKRGIDFSIVTLYRKKNGRGAGGPENAVVQAQVLNRNMDCEPYLTWQASDSADEGRK